MGWGEWVVITSVVNIMSSLRHDILPIAMGARLEDYEEVAPYKSFLHVDMFPGPRELAQYLLELDKDHQAYNQYFKVRLARTTTLIIWTMWENIIK